MVTTNEHASQLDDDVLDGELVSVTSAPGAAGDLLAHLPEHLRAELSGLLEDAERYAAAAQAPNTSRAYEA